ncbi:MAG: hypothetical protein J6Q92_07570 [Oscillospiraceae bacterium]|nr:hypothetical protein [Oscillospiraceae bacterium]
MFSILRKASTIFIVLAIIGFVCSLCVLLFTIEERLFNGIEENALAFFCLVFTLFSGPVVFACLAVICKILHQDLSAFDRSTYQQLRKIQNT